MDLDLDRPLRVGQFVAEKMSGLLISDSEFLKRVGIIDYSLLVGIHHVERPDSLERLGSPEELESSGLTDSDSESYWTIHRPQTDAERYFGSRPPVARPVDEALSDGGIVSVDGSEIYYCGIIDFLQRYDLGKKMERFVKVVFLQKDREGLSVQAPKKYQQRFVQQLTGVFE